MKQISNREYEKYQECLDASLHGRCLTPDGLRVVCAGLDYDPEKMSKADLLIREHGFDSMV